MKTKVLFLALALLALAVPRGVAQGEVSLQFFYDSLSPHGEWIEVEGYGECWQPTGIDEGWAPYTDGYWSYTDAGWTWVSYEEFGGVTYHYGRWVRADDVGWCWVPDTEWGPAWVSWRSSDDHIGWAPLPPEATFRASVGISTWVDDSYDIGPDYYNFCPIVEFGAPLIRTVCVPRFEVVSLYSRCVNITNISYNSYSDVVFCGGPSFVFISERCYRPIPALKLVRHFDHRGGRYNAWNEGNTLRVFAPKIVRNNTTIINKPRITKVVRKDKIDRGWGRVKDPEERRNLRAKIKAESKGLTAETAPARQPKPDDLKPVPKKADPKAPSPVAKAGPGRRDTDGDGIANRKDKDKDGDGIVNRKDKEPGTGAVTEGQGGKVAGDRDPQPGRRPGAEKMPGKVGVDPGAGRDADGDGIRNRDDKDKDGDGVNDRRPGDLGGTPAKKAGRDADGDGIRNRDDKDRDGDGVRDRQPAQGGGFQVPDRPRGARESVQPGNQGNQGDGGRAAARAARERQIEIQERQAAREQAAAQIARRQQQAEFQQKQAERAQRQQQIQRAPIQRPQVQQPQPRPQFERQRPPQQFQRPPVQQLPPRAPGGGGGGGGRGGKRNLTPEELEQLKKQRR